MEIMKTSANFSPQYIKTFFGSRAFDDLDSPQVDHLTSMHTPPLAKMTTRTVSTTTPPSRHPLLIILTPPLLLDPSTLHDHLSTVILQQDLLSSSTSLDEDRDKPLLVLTSRLTDPSNIITRSQVHIIGYQMHQDGYERAAEMVLERKALGPA